jgi:hypothetical protein
MAIILFATGRNGSGDGGCCIFCARNEVDRDAPVHSRQSLIMHVHAV